MPNTRTTARPSAPVRSRGCPPAPRWGRPDLVTQALVLLERHGLVLVAAGSTRAWKITAAGRLMLAPRRGPARERPVIGGGPHPR